VAGAGAEIAIAVPGWPVAEQQPLLVGSADQVLEGHAVHHIRRGGAFPDEPPEDAVAQFVGHFETLHQAIAQLNIRWLAAVPRQAFA
jgi:hypothetical protein